MVIMVHVISKDVPLFRRFTVNLIYLYNYWEFFGSRRDLAFVLKELRESIDCKIDCPAFNSCRIAGNCLFGVCDLRIRRLVFARTFMAQQELRMPNTWNMRTHFNLWYDNSLGH